MFISKIIIHQPVGLLRITTDEAHEGWCTGLPREIAPEAFEQMAQIVTGQSPFDRERLWQDLVAMDRERHTTLRGYVDIALWDLAAKSAGVPVYRHINGFRDRIPVYRRGHVDLPPDQIIEEAQQARQAGYHGYKVTANLPPDQMVPLAHDLREAVGDDFYLMFDGGAKMVIADAVKIGRTLDKTDFYWFDRPRPANDVTGGKQVADELDTPITTEVSSPMEASQVMATQSADHVRTGAPWAGGITDLLKIARCAESFGAFCHLDGPGRCDGFVHAHILGAIKNSPFFEIVEDTAPSPWVNNPLRINDGCIDVPKTPGLGMEIDLNMVEEQTEHRMES